MPGQCCPEMKVKPRRLRRAGSQDEPPIQFLSQLVAGEGAALTSVFLACTPRMCHGVNRLLLPYTTLSAHPPIPTGLPRVTIPFPQQPQPGIFPSKTKCGV